MRIIFLSYYRQWEITKHDNYDNYDNSALHNETQIQFHNKYGFFPYILRTDQELPDHEIALQKYYICICIIIVFVKLMKNHQWVKAGT